MNPTDTVDLEAFKVEREAALLSLDEATIRAYLTKWDGNPGPADPGVFWAGIHKAITGLPTLPLKARRRSKDWLFKRGLYSADDGDLGPQPAFTYTVRSGVCPKCFGKMWRTKDGWKCPQQECAPPK